MAGFSWEKRPLKRPKLGPPDVYPQDAKQREDELTAINVKQGFSHIPQISDEFGTAKNCNISEAKLGAFINGAISTKLKLNVLPDSGKRRLQVNTKDNFWPVTPRVSKLVESWMKDLCGTKPLSQLAKRVPIFNKREEIFLTLADHSVPMLRAAWFLKMTAAYNSAISEAKTKKRQIPDPSQEWTISLQRSLKELLLRLSDWYNGGTGAPNSLNSSNSSSSNPNPLSNLQAASGQVVIKTEGGYNSTGAPTNSASTGLTTADDGNAVLRQWQYCIDLAKHLYHEGLLDRLEWLIWVVEACERVKTLEDGTWKALIPVLLSFLPDIAQSEFLSRRLAYVAARRLSILFADFDLSAPPQNGNIVPQPPAALIEHLNCPSHRPTVLALVTVLQVIELDCPTALVHNGNSNSGGEGRTTISIPTGSPLDLLAVPPSALPMPPRANNAVIRTQLRNAEEQIRSRSRAVEANWSCEEWQQSSTGKTLEKVLHALDALDRHCFDKVDSQNTLEILYAKVFPDPPKKDNPEADAPIVLVLCQWAVGPHRTGEHRAIAVAKLLELRQSDYASAVIETESQVTMANNSALEGTRLDNSILSDDFPVNGPDSEGAPPNEINGSGSHNGSGAGNDDEADNPGALPVYHGLLFKFLDADAPTLDESSVQSKATFASLVHLFSALIRHDIFSHDSYLCTLVARGDLSAVPQPPPPITNAPSVPPIQSVATPGPSSHPGPSTPASVSSVTPGATPHHDLVDDRGPLFHPLPRVPEIPQRQPDYGDDRNIDDDLDRLLQHITQEQQNNMDQVDSPRGEDNPNSSNGGGFGSMSTPSHPTSSSNSNSVDPNPPNNGSNTASSVKPSASVGNSETLKQSRHRLYIMHFPLPQDESFNHESNQRHILLYGVGRARDEARHVVKKVLKELAKLFSKKFCYDITDSSRVKKHSKNEINMESLHNKFSALPYFDQHHVTWSTAQSVVEMFTSFSSGRSNYLPTSEHVAFLLELMESALNITGLLEVCIRMMRELPEIESQLVAKQSPIVGIWTTSLQLHLISILRRYHCSLLLDADMTKSAWDCLTRVVRRFSSSIECTSADRCCLAYLTELYTSCAYLKSKNFHEYLTPTANKIRIAMCNQVHPSESPPLKRNNSFMTSCLDNPRRKVESSIIRQLVENPACRYSFICNAVLSICNEADTERLNDLAALCAEMTAACPALAPEWLALLLALCKSGRKNATYAEIFNEIDVKHMGIHSSLATLTAMLVARQCFTLQDFCVVAVPTLLKVWNDGKTHPIDPESEPGARLTCSLLLNLFRAQDSNNPEAGPHVLKFSCDRRLLSATHTTINLGAFLVVLKTMLLVADAPGCGERRKDQRNIAGLTQGELSISHILGTTDAPSERCDVMRGEPRTLASFASSALYQMCGEPWVRQRSLQCPDITCSCDHLIDPMVNARQAQKLLHLICYREMVLPDDSLDPKTHIPRIMKNLDQWNMREAWLVLTLQNKQLAENTMEHQNWLDIVARAALDVFHLGNDENQDYNPQVSAVPSPAPGKSPRSGKKTYDSNSKTPPNSNGSNSSYSARNNVNGEIGSEKACEKSITSMHSPNAAWLVASLLERLSSAVQGRVLRHAGAVLENTLWIKKKRQGLDCASKGSLEAHLPFLSLILSCLKGQDEQREGLLASLLSQLNQILSHSKDPDFDSSKDSLRDALRLRLNLVGGMFDAIQRSSSATSDWAIVLTQLVTHGVVDLNTNSDVFPTILDMVTALVHSTQFSDNSDRMEENRKQNLNLIKKLKKELADKNSDSIKPLRQLLPVSKVQTEVVVTQPTSTTIDSKGNRIQSYEMDKKPGLKVWEKQRITAWELLEAQRNPAPLSWAWFGAVKMERKPLRYEDTHRLLKYHSHSLVKPSSYYLDPPPLPPEDIDIKPDIIIKEEIVIKPDTPSSDQSPRGTPIAGRKPKAPRKKRQTKAQQAQAAAQLAAQQQATLSSAINQPPVPAPNQVRPGSPYTAPVGPQMGPGGVNPSAGNYGPGPPPQWSSGYQQPYFPQNPGVRPTQSKQSVQALQNMLQVRHRAPQQTPGQFQQFQGPGAGTPASRPILRQQLRPSQPAGPPMPNQQFQSQVQTNQSVMYSQQPMAQPGMNQNFPYNGPQSGNVNPGPQGSLPNPQGMMPQQQQQMLGGPRGPGPGGPEMNNFGPQVRGMTQRPFMPQSNQGAPGMNMPQNFRMSQMNQMNQMVQGGPMGQPQMSQQQLNQPQLNQGPMAQQGQMMGQMMNQSMMGQGQQMMGQNQQMMNQSQTMMSQGQQMMSQNQNMMGPNQGMMGQGQQIMGQQSMVNQQRYRMMMQQQQQGQAGQMGPGQMVQGGPQQSMGMGGPRGPMHFSNQPQGYQ